MDQGSLLGPELSLGEERGSFLSVRGRGSATFPLVAQGSSHREKGSLPSEGGQAPPSMDQSSLNGLYTITVFLPLFQEYHLFI